MPAFIALAASSTSGTNRMPSRKSMPTMRMPSTSASLSTLSGPQPRSSRIVVPSTISSREPVVQVVVHLRDEVLVAQCGEIEIVLSSFVGSRRLLPGSGSTIRNRSASWNTIRTKVTPRNLARSFRSGVLTPHTVATTIESKRTDSRCGDSPSEEDQSQASARVRRNHMWVAAGSDGMRRRTSGRAASDPRRSSKHRPVDSPPAGDDDHATKHDGSVSADNGGDRTDNKPAQRRRPSQASRDRSGPERLVRVQRSQTRPDERREGRSRACSAFGRCSKPSSRRSWAGTPPPVRGLSRFQVHRRTSRSTAGPST